jgi:hypothetical protein
MLDERSLTKGEGKKKEKYVKGMKKSFSDFRSRYGDDAKSIMYATATKMAKEGSYDKFDRRVNAAGAAKSSDARIKILKSAIPLRPKVAEETLDEALPLVVSGGMAVARMAASQALKKGTQKVGQSIAKSAVDMAKNTVKDKVKDEVKDKAKETVKKGHQATSNRPGTTTYTKSKEEKPEEKKDDKKKVKKREILDKAYTKTKQKVQSGGERLSGIFEPKESYEQERELLTFSDFREIASICVADEEEVELDEFFGPQTVTPKNSPSGTKSVQVGKPYPAKLNGQPVMKIYDKKGGSSTRPMSTVEKIPLYRKYGHGQIGPIKQSYEPEGEVLEAAPIPHTNVKYDKHMKKIVPSGGGVPVPRASKQPTTQMAHYEPEGEQIDEFNIIQRAMDVVDKINRTNQKKVDMINKVRPGSATMPKHGYFTPQKKTNESAAWTRKAGKNSEGGLNEKGRKSYEKENPGSDLKAPSKKVGNPRRASFCARMSGMKKKLTSKKTASDPDSRINKSLRAWNC